MKGEGRVDLRANARDAFLKKLEICMNTKNFTAELRENKSRVLSYNNEIGRRISSIRRYTGDVKRSKVCCRQYGTKLESHNKVC